MILSSFDDFFRASLGHLEQFWASLSGKFGSWRAILNNFLPAWYGIDKKAVLQTRFGKAKPAGFHNLAQDTPQPCLDARNFFLTAAHSRLDGFHKYRNKEKALSNPIKPDDPNYQQDSAANGLWILTLNLVHWIAVVLRVNTARPKKKYWFTPWGNSA